MAKQKHWAVPVTFKVHSERAGEAQHLIEELVQKLSNKSSDDAELVMTRVHRPERMRGPADTCEKCKAE
jgi:hypothetical protein